MAHKTLIDGTSYSIVGGTTLVDGTSCKIVSGRTLIDGTGYDIPFNNNKQLIHATKIARATAKTDKTSVTMDKYISRIDRNIIGVSDWDQIESMRVQIIYRNSYYEKGTYGGSDKWYYSWHYSDPCWMSVNTKYGRSLGLYEDEDCTIPKTYIATATISTSYGVTTNYPISLKYVASGDYFGFTGTSSSIWITLIDYYYWDDVDNTTTDWIGGSSQTITYDTTTYVESLSTMNASNWSAIDRMQIFYRYEVDSEQESFWTVPGDTTPYSDNTCTVPIVGGDAYPEYNIDQYTFGVHLVPKTRVVGSNSAGVLDKIVVYFKA